MTGSRRAFIYNSDDGSAYGIERDESSGEASAAGGILLLDPYVAGTPTLPCGIRPRYVNAVLTTDSNVRKRFVVGSALTMQGIQGGTPIVEGAGGLAAGGTYNVTSKVGERARLLRTSDTGQTDGDNP